MKRAACTSLLMAFAVACTPRGVADTAAQADDTSFAVDDSGTDDTSQPEPERFRVLGTLTVQDGEYAAAEVQYRLLADDGTEICTQTHAAETVTMALSPEPEWVFDWARLDLADTDEWCQASLPSSLGVGLGLLYTEVVPHLEASGVAEVQSSLQGFYASFEQPWSDGIEQSTLAMGYAGTEQALAGEIQAAESGPLPDGVYSFRSVFTLTLE